MLAFFIRTVVVAIALWVAVLLVPGIALGGGTTTAGVGTLIVVALIFGLVNAVVKPIVQIVGCAFYILTLGLISDRR